MKKNQKIKNVLVVGGGKSIYSIVICLAKNGVNVLLLSEDVSICKSELDKMLIDRSLFDDLNIIIADSVSTNRRFDMGIAHTDEVENEKEHAILLLEKYVSETSVIAVNTEIISLRTLQKKMKNGSRLIGVNWVEPACTTFFLEIINNNNNVNGLANSLLEEANSFWKKDGYIVESDLGVRSKFFTAIVREALFLVENDYASIEDIDRACRNDPGYYMSFAGNLRYMDLMGTFSYGIVMKELNKELSKATELPLFFKELKEKQNNLTPKEKYISEKNKENIQNDFQDFSTQIKDIIEKYPFNF